MDGFGKRVRHVFTKEYRKDVAQQIYLEKEAAKPNSELRLKDRGPDMKEVSTTLEENKIPTEFRISPIFEKNEETPTDSSEKSAHQEFVESLEFEQEDSDGDEELRRLAEKAQIHPLMPIKPTASERAKLREFERRLITGSDDPDVKISAEMLESIPTKLKRYTPEEKNALRKFEKELLEGIDLDI